jgi:hypothetical protein
LVICPHKYTSLNRDSSPGGANEGNLLKLEKTEWWERVELRWS